MNDPFDTYLAQARSYNDAADEYNEQVHRPYMQQYGQYEQAYNDWSNGPRTTDYEGPARPPDPLGFDMPIPKAPPGLLEMATGGEVEAPEALEEEEQDAQGDALVLPKVAQQEEDRPLPVATRKVVKKGSGASSKKGLSSSELMQLPVGGLGQEPPAKKGKGQGSARAQMEELARVYKKRMGVIQNKARGLSASTFGVPTLEGETLTQEEFSRKNFAQGGEVTQEPQEPGLLGVSSYATEAAERMFPSRSGQDDERDAARHMLAAGIVARKYGPKAAQLLGKAHERASSPESFFSMFGIGKPRDDYEMDVHNNRIGAELAARATSQAELEKLVQSMARQSVTRQTPDKPWIMSEQDMEARRQRAAKGPTPPPEYRAEGSPEEGEVSQEEIDAASRPAFVTPKSGKGRKEGEVSKALKSGEAYSSMAKGVTELPYDLAGMPVDLTTMALRPFGYSTQKPVMGSDFIKEKMTALGVRPEPPADPTQKGFYTAGEMLSNLTNPAGAVRAGAKGAQKAGQAVTDVAKDFQEYNRQLAVPGASYVSRAPGGYFPTSRVEGGILSNLDKALDPVLKKVRDIEDPEQRQALTMLFNQKAKDFFTKQAGSIEDPLRKDILSGALKFDDKSPVGDVFPRTLQRNVAQGDLQALRLLEKNYDEMIGIRSVVPRVQEAEARAGVPQAQIMANIQENLDKIPDAQLVAYYSAKPVADPAMVPKLAAQIREKVKANPTLFSTALEPQINRTLFVNSTAATDVDMARYPGLYGLPATEAMVTPGLNPPDFGSPVPSEYFLPEMKTAISKGQPIQDIGRSSIKLLGMDAETLLSQARQMPVEELNRMGFPDFVKKAYANTQQVSLLEAALPKVKNLIRAGKTPPAEVMTYGISDFLPTGGDFRWVKVTKPDGVRAIAAGMDNSVASYATSQTYGGLNKGRSALENGEAEVYSLYDKNNVPHVTVEYLTAKPGVPDSKKNSIAQLTGNGPLTANNIPENYAPQIVDLLNNLRPSSVPPSIKRLLEKTGQKGFLSEDVLAPLYFGVPAEALRAP